MSNAQHPSSARSATYRELFGVREYRVLFVANTLSHVGDMLTRVAIAVLVFDRTGSSLLTAIAFAISFLPNFVAGPFLAAIADRYPRKTVLVVCDVVRAILVGLVATGVLPLPVVFVALFTAGLVTFPAWAARSALLPTILPGDTYTLGIAVSVAMYQISQVIGFALGGALVVTFTSYGVLALDALTFVLSALLLAVGLHARPAPQDRRKQGSLAADTFGAVRLILGHPILRKILLVAWLTSAFAMAHEGLAPALAASLGGGSVAVGLLLAAAPAGIVMSSFVATRMLSPVARLKTVPLFAALACVSLVPVGILLPLWAVLLCYFAGGVGMAVTIPLNATYNRLLPTQFRGRAAGIAIAGITLAQAITMIATGLLADVFAPRWVVSVVGVLGLVAIWPLIAHWPTTEELTTPVDIPPREHS